MQEVTTEEVYDMTCFEKKQVEHVSSVDAFVFFVAVVFSNVVRKTFCRYTEQIVFGRNFIP